jgi:predicted O-methyltransferase YrrM
MSQFTPKETKHHITDLGCIITKPIWELWLLLALNLDFKKAPPIITQFPEIVILRGIYLRDLAIRNQAEVFLEIGTARGWQTMLWNDYLVNKRVYDGRIYTCDVIGMDEICFKTPVTGDEMLSRRQLWYRYSRSYDQVKFFLRDKFSIATNVKRTLDMVYIDGEHTRESVLKDFQEVLPLCREGTIIVFDDFDERFPGVQAAVYEIAQLLKCDLEITTFEPHQYRIGLIQLGKPLHL